MTDTADRDLVGVSCWRPGCHKIVVVPLGSTPPHYCTPKCAKQADEDYTAAQDRVEHLRDLLTRSRYWLASFDRGDDAPTTGANQAAREALALAQGTLRGLEGTGGPQSDRERYVAEALEALISAVEPLIADTTGLPAPQRRRIDRAS